MTKSTYTRWKGKGSDSYLTTFLTSRLRESIEDAIRRTKLKGTQNKDIEFDNVSTSVPRFCRLKEHDIANKMEVKTKKTSIHFQRIDTVKSI